ncbi:MAG: mechanosensitive ion channel [Candidatus Marinimicrobia bacterium]|nr:mechanosensitive ion channel [Candidatus Neomarinimicrobiota bacterium]
MILEQLTPYLPEHPLLQSLSILAILFTLSIIAYGITEKVILRLLTGMFKKTRTELDDILANRNIFNRLAYIVPALIFYNFAYLIPQISNFVQRGALSLMTLAGLLVLNSFLSAIGDIYQKTKYSERMHIKSYLQITKLIVNILGVVVIAAILIGKSPAWLLSGIGALTAVLMLIFKDTILSLVASLQISSNDLFKIGDWLEAPHFGADGDVVDIALHAVKIQNWDKTISVIPTYKLIDSAFKNWRGMSESGGRRIKRSLFIDLNSIRLCDDAMLDTFNRFELLKDYMGRKITEITQHNQTNNINTEELINGRRLTNVGCFRAYIESYLRSNSKINEDMTFLIRQLEPTSKGLPLQIYVFTNDTDWIRYEGIQADIFDHLLAVIPEFGLKVFQSPTGKDFGKLKKG